MNSTKSNQEIIDLMVIEEDNRRAIPKATRHASFRSAQQNTQNAQGASFAMALGFGLSVAVVALTWGLTR